MSNDKPHKAYAPVAFGSSRLTTGKMSLSMNVKDFLAVHLPLDEFVHFLRGVMTDNEEQTQFFRGSQFRSKLWNFSGQALQFYSILARVPGIESPAADFLIRLYMAPTNRVHLKMIYLVANHCVEIDMAFKTPAQDETKTTSNRIKRRQRTLRCLQVSREAN